MGDFLIPADLYQKLKAAVDARLSGEITYYFSDGRVQSYKLTEGGKTSEGKRNGNGFVTKIDGLGQLLDKQA